MDEKELRGILSANIKRYRGRKGLSQLALALKLGISTNFLSDIETGKKWVSPATLVKLAMALNIEVHELFKAETKRKEQEKQTQQDVTAIIVDYTKEASAVVKRSLETFRNTYIEGL
ncbi:MAG: helix-turn-helix domain-containing protein [Spirochaetales bacterium]|jgi:transcriptional regulator with XRE-family HTH domain|nr:helix-turn-helix domain-containing protein [Spirochaetales bacterium]